jgi:hypothetical protein
MLSSFKYQPSLQSTYPQNGFRSALIFAPLITLLERWLHFNRVIIQLILRPRFVPQIKVTRVLKDYSSAQSVSFGQSSIAIVGERLTAERIVNRDDEYLAGIGVFWKFFTDRSREVGFIQDAEDPRVFEYLSRCYIYYQKFNSALNDCEIWLHRPQDKRSWRLKSPFQISGKNWVPFDIAGRLFFIYAFEPLIIIEYDLKDTSETELDPIIVYNGSEGEFSPLWGDEKESFGQVRGGTPMIPFDDNHLIAFTHITPKGVHKESHRLGVVLLNINDFTAKHRDLTHLRNRLLLNPFGIRSLDHHLLVELAVTSGNPGVRNVLSTRQEWQFSKSEISRLFES